MIRRLIPAAVAATGLVATMLAVAPGASAGTTSCTVTNYSPRTVVMGLSPVTKTFGVSAGCALQSWTIDISDKFYVIDSTSPKETFDPNLFYNSAAGLKVDAKVDFVDDIGTSSSVPFNSSFALKRRTSWTTFNASPEPVTKGQPIKITGTLKVANWETHKYVAQKGSRVSLQFKKDGTSSYVTVKTVTTSLTYGTVSTSVNATYDGRWRLVYGGSGTRGPATSLSDYVDVR